MRSVNSRTAAKAVDGTGLRKEVKQLLAFLATEATGWRSEPVVNLTNREMAQALGVKPRAVQNRLSILLNAGLITKSGNPDLGERTISLAPYAETLMPTRASPKRKPRAKKQAAPKPRTTAGKKAKASPVKKARPRAAPPKPKPAPKKERPQLTLVTSPEATKPKSANIRDIYPPAFLTFFKAFPGDAKGPLKTAHEKWIRAKKQGVSEGYLLECANRLAEAYTGIEDEAKYLGAVATWINNRRWESIEADIRNAQHRQRSQPRRPRNRNEIAG